MSGPHYFGSNIQQVLQSKREPSVPVASSITVLSGDRTSKAFSSRTADPLNLRPVMHQSKIAVETKCNSIKLAFLNTGRAFWDGTQMVQVILRRKRLLCEYRRAYVSVDVHDMRSPTRLNSCTALV